MPHHFNIIIEPRGGGGFVVHCNGNVRVGSVVLSESTFEMLNTADNELAFTTDDSEDCIRYTVTRVITPLTQDLDAVLTAYVINLLTDVATQMQSTLRIETESPYTVALNYIDVNTIEVSVARKGDLQRFPLIGGAHITGIQEATLRWINEELQRILHTAVTHMEYEKMISDIVSMFPISGADDYVVRLINLIKAAPRPTRPAVTKKFAFNYRKPRSVDRHSTHVSTTTLTGRRGVVSTIN